MYFAAYIGVKSMNPKARFMDTLIAKTTSERKEDVYSHVEYIKEFNPGAVSSCWSSSFRDSGIRSKNMYLGSSWHIYWNPDSTPEDRVYADLWYKDHLGCGYDWPGVLGFHLGGFQMGFLWHCSESTAECSRLPDSHRYSPNSFIRTLKHRVNNDTGEIIKEVHDAS
jgi:hypothetical protein